MAAHAQNSVQITPDGGVVVQTPTEHISVGNGGVHIHGGGASIVAPAAPQPPAITSAEPMQYTNGDYSNLDFSNKDLRGSAFVNSSLSNISFRGADLRGASFSNVDMQGCDLRGALVTGASFVNVDFGNARIGGVDFSQATLVNSTMDSADLRVDSSVAATTITAALTDRSAGVAPEVNLAVYFEFDKDTLTKQGWQQVSELAKALSDPALASATIRIEGHTDAKGSDEYNMDLSYRRAARVMRTLSEQLGIAASRLSIQGHGESQPIADNHTDFGRAQNRRVTVVNLSQ